MMSQKEMCKQVCNEYGYSDIQALLQDYIMESVVPGVCRQCGYVIGGIEPDGDQGVCEACGCDDAASIFVILRLI